MIVLELLQIMHNSSLVDVRRRLPYLEDVPIRQHLRRSNGEGYHQADIVLLHKIGKHLHLFGIERSENDIALSSGRVFQNLGHISILGGIPSMNVNRQTRLLQTVAGHQDTTVVLYHPLSVAVDIVQGQHHPDTDFPLAHIIDRCLTLSSSNCRLFRIGCRRRVRFRIRDIEHSTLLQLISRLFHLGISLD